MPHQSRNGSISRALLRPTSRSRVRSLMASVCCLVALSLVHSLLGSTLLRPIEANLEEKTLVDNNPVVSKQTTNSPTLSPVAPKQAVQSPSTPGSRVTPPHAQPPSRQHLLGNVTFPSPALTNQSSAFVERWCDLSRVKWYPEDPQTRHQPYFLIPGAKFTGTSVLSRMLVLNPHLAAPYPSHESGFFLQGNFRNYVTRNEKTLVHAARKRMSAAHFPHNNAISFDASPGYLFYSSLLPRRILCVVPWVKLVVLLRDPVDRILQQFAAAKRKGYKRSLEDWVNEDFQLLQRVGVITNSSKPLNIRQSGVQQTEDLAWYKYHTTPGEGGPIGRSLYDIQLRQWFQALQAAGKDPAEDVLMVWTERLAEDPATEYQRIVQFLRLPDAEIPPNGLQSLANKLKPRGVITPALRKRLENFFVPYKRRLETLLKQYSVELGK